jgi:hypothetical protein
MAVFRQSEGCSSEVLVVLGAAVALLNMFVEANFTGWVAAAVCQSGDWTVYSFAPLTSHCFTSPIISPHLISPQRNSILIRASHHTSSHKIHNFPTIFHNSISSVHSCRISSRLAAPHLVKFPALSKATALPFPRHHIIAPNDITSHHIPSYPFAPHHMISHHFISHHIISHDVT